MLTMKERLYEIFTASAEVNGLQISELWSRQEEDFATDPACPAVTLKGLLILTDNGLYQQLGSIYYEYDGQGIRLCSSPTAMRDEHAWQSAKWHALASAELNVKWQFDFSTQIKRLINYWKRQPDPADPAPVHPKNVRRYPE